MGKRSVQTDKRLLLRLYRDNEKQRYGKQCYVSAREIITLTIINMLNKQGN